MGIPKPKPVSEIPSRLKQVEETLSAFGEMMDLLVKSVLRYFTIRLRHNLRFCVQQSEKSVAKIMYIRVYMVQSWRVYAHVPQHFLLLFVIFYGHFVSVINSLLLYVNYLLANCGSGPKVNSNQWPGVSYK